MDSLNTSIAESSARAALRFIAPQIPTLATEPPEGDGWLHEIKHDGYRTQLVVEDGACRAFTRRGHDWTERYGAIVNCATGLACDSAIIDGEMVVQDESGVTDFHALRRAIEGCGEGLIFFGFDLIHQDDRDLRNAPLVERRALLKEMLGPRSPRSPIQFSDHYEGDGAALFAAAERLGVEGIVSKKKASRYRSGPAKAWLKTKCMTEGEFVVVGMERNEGGPPFALLAREEDGGLIYCGSAFVTLHQSARDEFWTRAEALKIDRPALPELRKGHRKASFARPEMRVRARHLRGGEMLRHATLTAVLP